jgi:hypothetical protein
MTTVMDTSRPRYLRHPLPSPRQKPAAASLEMGSKGARSEPRLFGEIMVAIVATSFHFRTMWTRSESLNRYSFVVTSDTSHSSTTLASKRTAPMTAVSAKELALDPTRLSSSTRSSVSRILPTNATIWASLQLKSLHLSTVLSTHHLHSPPSLSLTTRKHAVRWLLAFARELLVTRLWITVALFPQAN